VLLFLIVCVVTRNFQILVDRTWHSDYRSQYLVLAMGIRRDGVRVFATNGAAIHPPELELKIRVAHAEQRLAQKLDSGSVVYVVRLLRNGIHAMAKPCGTCERILRARGVKRAYYTIAPNEFGVLDLAAR